MSLRDDRLKALGHALTLAIAEPLSPQEALDLLEEFSSDVDSTMEGLKSGIRALEAP